MRGAAFTNKMMAKQKNNQKFKARMANKIRIEQMQNRDQVNAYGGLGKVGLDYKHQVEDRNGDAYEVPAFSPALAHLAPKPKPQESDEELISESDEEMLCDGFEKMEDELKQIDTSIVDEDPEDAAAYQIPSTDEGFLKILKEKFGHESFREGQLEAIKIMLSQKSNALVVLATGGGKSLIYQFVSLFMPGLILVVTPLIALMTDQLNKLPDFLPGASINSQ